MRGAALLLLDRAAGAVGVAAGAEEVIGTMLTPVTFPDTSDFCFLPAGPRAMRVAFVLALAAARASAVKGLGDFLGVIARSARVWGSFLNIKPTTSLASFTISLFACA